MESQPPAPPTLEQLERFKIACERFNDQKISTRELVEAAGDFQYPGLIINIPFDTLRESAKAGVLCFYDPLKEQNPVTVGSNATRVKGFTFDPKHPKGELLSGWKAKIIIPAINLAHKMILKGYDMNAYVYDDNRLQAQNQFFRKYISEKFQHAEYKMDFMNKIVDIIMFLRKEDIYYGARILDMLNGLPRFELTEAEAENVRQWH